MITCSSRAAQSRPTRIRTLRNALCAAACILLAAHQHAFAQNNSNPLMQGRGGDLIFPAALERHDWAAAAALPLRPNRYPYAQAIPHFARTVGLARSGHPDEAQREIDQLAALVKALTDAKNPYWAGQVEIQRKIAAAWTAHALGHEDEALALMQAASKEEDGLETHDTLNPGRIGMTADEGLGMLLLELKRPAEAFKAFEASLRIAKNRLQSYAGAASAAAAANDAQNARKYYAKVIELAGAANGARAEIAEAKAYIARAQ